MSGHLCEEPFCAEDALGSLKQVSLSPFYPKIREIGAVRLSNRGEAPTPFPPLPPSSPWPGDFHRAEHAWRTQQPCTSSLQAWCQHPCKRQLWPNNQNLGFNHRNLYTNTIRTHRLFNCSLQAGCPHPGKRQRRQNNQNLGLQPTRKRFQSQLDLSRRSCQAFFGCKAHFAYCHLAEEFI